MLDVLQSAGALVGSLLVSSHLVASVDTLPVGPIKLILFAGWIYLSLYLVQRVENHALIPFRYRTVIQVVSVFFGPPIFLTLVLLDAQKSSAQSPENGNVFTVILARLRAAVQNIWNSGESSVEDDDTLRIFDSSGTELSEIYGHGQNRAEQKHILDMTSQMIDNALQQRASDILIDPKDQTMYSIRLRIDGMLRTVQDLPFEACRAVINSIKAVSNMDISERRRPQDGAFLARKGAISLSFRVASAGALNGEKLSVRVLNRNAASAKLADVGIPQAQCDIMVDAIDKPAGMVLVCGPTGSGKTTTLYAMLNQIDRFSRNVITVEDPIEAHLPEASQLEINAKADITFAKALRSILRQDPDVICVGEIRDEETASIALRAAQTGHLVLATIHCDSNAAALVRLMDLGVSPMLLSSGLRMLVSQRLMRRLCDRCKKPAQLGENSIMGLRQKGIDISNICEPNGCEYCGGTGYYGRLAICDILSITEDMRAEIAAGGAIAGKLRNDGEKKARVSLKSEALKNVIAGTTSLEEVKRVVG
jgi:general secretion pathway protein E